jgi:lysophospholipid acyltransferase (LPLAT)-like uncharacterized protein
MKPLWRKVRGKIFRGLIYHVASLIGRTLRIESPRLQEVLDRPGGKIIAGWHGRSLVAGVVFRNRGVYTIISHSRDGEMQNYIFRKFGFKTIRGSSSRGGIKAAVESIRVLRKGGAMAFTPDGPRGPSGVVQTGIMVMAQKSGAPIIPGAFHADRRWVLGTWDSYMVPKPFARVVLLFGDPIFVPKEATPEEVEALRLHLQDEMHRLENEAAVQVGHEAKSRPIE